MTAPIHTALPGAASSSEHGPKDEGLIAYLERQWAWSKDTFGPTLRTRGIIQHITKELREIEAEPHDLAEWVDVVILAMDGFWRHGGRPADLLPAMQAKQDRNFAQAWPDWRTMGEDQAIEHDRSDERAVTGSGALSGSGEGVHQGAPASPSGSQASPSAAAHPRPESADPSRDALRRAVQAFRGSELWLDNNHPWRIMLKRGRWNLAVAEQHCETACGDGEWKDGAAICAIVNAAIKLCAEDVASPPPVEQEAGR